MTSRRRWSDLNCIVQVNEHPFVKVESVIEYALGRMMSRDDWNLALTLAKSAYPPVDQKLLARIQQGAITSDQTPQNLKDLVRTSLISQLGGP